MLALWVLLIQGDSALGLPLAIEGRESKLLDSALLLQPGKHRLLTLSLSVVGSVHANTWAICQ